MSRYALPLLIVVLLGATPPPRASAQLLDRLEGLLQRLPGGDDTEQPAAAEQPAAEPAESPRIEIPEPAPRGPLVPPPVELPNEETRPGYLGLVADHTEEEPPRVVVLRVNEGGPAAAAGVRAGDLIVGVEDFGIGSLNGLGAALAERHEGETIRLVVEREGETLRLPVTLGAVPGTPQPAPRGALPTPGSEPPPTTGGGWLGVHVTPLTESTARLNRLPVRSGAVISSIRGGSPAERAALPVGGVIVALDGAPVASPDALVAAIGARGPGDTVELDLYRGSQLVRYSVPLAAAPPQTGGGPLAPGSEPGRGGARRPLLEEPPLGGPLLDRLGGALDRLAGPRDSAPAADDAEVDSLREQVELLTRQVELMRGQIERLERELEQAQSAAGNAAPPQRPAVEPGFPNPSQVDPLPLNPAPR